MRRGPGIFGIVFVPLMVYMYSFQMEYSPWWGAVAQVLLVFAFLFYSRHRPELGKPMKAAVVAALVILPIGFYGFTLAKFPDEFTTAPSDWVHTERVQNLGSQSQVLELSGTGSQVATVPDLSATRGQWVTFTVQTDASTPLQAEAEVRISMTKDGEWMEVWSGAPDGDVQNLTLLSPQIRAEAFGTGITSQSITITYTFYELQAVECLPSDDSRCRLQN